MDVLNKKVIFKYTKKDKNLLEEFNEFIKKIEKANWKKSIEVKSTFNDSDTITKNVYIFNIKKSRLLCVIYFDYEEIEIVWAGSHDDYVGIFKNNKKTILKFLTLKGYEL